ncbi:MAG: efflux RND transporter periplasmic adaptor subunit [Hyphomicrobiaceae bacterium]
MKRYALAAAALLVLGTLSWALLNGKLDQWKPALPAVSMTQEGRSGADKAKDEQAPVEVVASRSAELTRDIQAVGSLQSDESVSVAPEIAGRVIEIAFDEGQPVKRGQTVVKLDDDLAKAELAQAEAALKLATANNVRTARLSKSGTVAQRTTDEAKAAYEQAVATVELARLKIDRHVLRAPFDGVARMRNVSVGAFIGVGTPIVGIEKIDVLKVDFRIPEILLAAVKVGQKVTVEVDALPEQTFDGTIYAIDPAVDVNGRSLWVRAKLTNESNLLRPGLFARITIRGLDEREVVLVPESAIVPRGGESLVFKVENGKAVASPVTLGERRSGEVEVVSGLTAGTSVVVGGQQRLRDGVAVEVVAPAGQSDNEGRATVQPLAKRS